MWLFVASPRGWLILAREQTEKPAQTEAVLEGLEYWKNWDIGRIGILEAISYWGKNGRTGVCVHNTFARGHKEKAEFTLETKRKEVRSSTVPQGTRLRKQTMTGEEGRKGRGVIGLLLRSRLDRVEDRVQASTC